jgi:elongation factor Ts
MQISVDQIKALREETGISIGKCKEVLVEAAGDMDAARVLLRDVSAKAAEKKADRELGAGVVESYIHPNKTIGVLIKLSCETDYVARNQDFLSLAGNIAMHIAAMGTETKEELLQQAFVKNPEITISKLIEDATLKIGERIDVTEFNRFSI